MAGTSKLVSALAGILAVAACSGPRSPDTNLLTGRCTNREHSHGPVPRIPASAPVAPGLGSVVGTLVDSTGALPSYPIRAEMIGGGANAPHATATPDSSGGFVFAGLPPGQYRLYARAYAHKPDSVNVAIEAGRVDTVSVRLQFFECVR